MVQDKQAGHFQPIFAFLPSFEFTSVHQNDMMYNSKVMVWARWMQGQRNRTMAGKRDI